MISKPKKKQDFVHVVTMDHMPGYEIKEVKGIVWGSSVRARFVGKDIIAILRAFTGGEIPEYTEMVNEARLYAVHRMAMNAKKLGANAVVSMKIGSTAQILPGTAEIAAYGTAVVVEPKK